MNLQQCKDGSFSHHWLIGELGGQPKDVAICKLCRITKDMPDPYVDVPYRELQKRAFGRGKEERAAIVCTARGDREI